jgi:hypothetical protein
MRYITECIFNSNWIRMLLYFSWRLMKCIQLFTSHCLVLHSIWGAGLQKLHWAIISKYCKWPVHLTALNIQVSICCFQSTSTLSLNPKKCGFVTAKNVVLYLKRRKTKTRLRSQFLNKNVAIIIIKISEKTAMYWFYQFRNKYNIS